MRLKYALRTIPEEKKNTKKGEKKGNRRKKKRKEKINKPKS